VFGGGARCPKALMPSIWVSEGVSKTGQKQVSQPRGVECFFVPKRHAPPPQLHRAHPGDQMKLFGWLDVIESPILVVGGALGWVISGKRG
jgi:hypothetical protein